MFYLNNYFCNAAIYADIFFMLDQYNSIPK